MGSNKPIVAGLRSYLVLSRTTAFSNDLIISSNHYEIIQKFKNNLSRCFYMKDLGLLKYFLGVEVARGPDDFFLCQQKYALDIITEVILLGGRSASTPLEQNHHLAHYIIPLLDNPERYRQLVDRLIYLCFTYPDLAYSVHVLS
ncbi:retrovirus-related Pol polyprotein from transposon TNT 1-94 [Senna tora]|uniref:Retrovirus-related Pol polyprotein from transposon TNT 1-94 n=1 Tax=Senna tora TaxID=362788 RepID=A0A834TZY7_9FABA|nr:retrovirus-related Pol polyprotein from transposon TNT 1-94 [Senna tora]